MSARTRGSSTWDSGGQGARNSSGAEDNRLVGLEWIESGPGSEVGSSGARLDGRVRFEVEEAKKRESEEAEYARPCTAKAKQAPEVAEEERRRRISTGAT